MEIYNIHETKTHLSQILALVDKGEDVLIGKAGRPIAKLSKYEVENEPRKFDAPWRGKVWVSEDFDKTDDDIINSFYGDDSK